eukprot:GHVS01036171.1.p1 GENE.GHVS01036171.1~~GHVS01036171.1.p1  ORF type:complete len:970 (-),score=160.15 GHVS01036171.1:1929-4838(-)
MESSPVCLRTALHAAPPPESQLERSSTPLRSIMKPSLRRSLSCKPGSRRVEVLNRSRTLGVGASEREEMDWGGRRGRANSDEFDVAGGGGIKKVGGSYRLRGTNSVTSLMMMALGRGCSRSISSNGSGLRHRSRHFRHSESDSFSFNGKSPSSRISDRPFLSEEHEVCEEAYDAGSETGKNSGRASIWLSRAASRKSVAFDDDVFPSDPFHHMIPSVPLGSTDVSCLQASQRTMRSSDTRSSMDSGGSMQCQDELMLMMSLGSSSVGHSSRCFSEGGEEDREESEEDRQRRMMWRRKREGGSWRGSGSFAGLRNRWNNSGVSWRWSEPPMDGGSRGRRMVGPELKGDIVLVTGATSFLGCHLVMALLDRGVCVRAVTRRLLSSPRSSSGSGRHHDSREVVEGGECLMRIHPNAGKQLQIIEGDVYACEEEWKQLFDGCRYMVWACVDTKPTADYAKRPAGEGKGAEESDGREEMEEGVARSVMAVRNVFGWAAKYGVTRSVIMSNISESSGGCRAVRSKGKRPEDEDRDKLEAWQRKSMRREDSMSYGVFALLLDDAVAMVTSERNCGDAQSRGSRMSSMGSGDESMGEEQDGERERISGLADDHMCAHYGAENAMFRQRALTELAAWDVSRKCPTMELVSVCSGWLFGSLLLQRHSQCMSVQLIEGLLLGRWPFLPVYGCPPVDVRDVAVAGVLGLILPAEKVVGKRLLIGAHETMSLSQVGYILKIEFEEFGFEPSISEGSTIVAETMAALMDTARNMFGGERTVSDLSERDGQSSPSSPSLRCDSRSRERTEHWWYWNEEGFGRLVQADLSKSNGLLGIGYRPVAKAIVDSVMSMMALRILPQRHVPDDLIEYALFYQMGYRVSDPQTEHQALSRPASIASPIARVEREPQHNPDGEEAVREESVACDASERRVLRAAGTGTRLREKVMTRGGEDVTWARHTDSRERNNTSQHVFGQFIDGLFGAD